MGRSTGLADQPSETTAGAERVSLESDPRWQVARRIAASRGFVKSRFLTAFILFICEKQLLDQTDVLTEQQIGEQVFQRPQGYNPGDDNIVRNYARLLRQRLEEYFTGEGVDEKIRIVVPRGGYVPLFVEEGTVIGGNKPVAAVDPEYRAPTLPASDSGVGSNPPAIDVPARSSWLLKALCVTLFAALILLLLRDLHVFQPQPTVTDRFWSVFFNPTRDTLVIPADSGFAMYQGLTRKRIHLADYVGGEYQKDTVAEPGISPAIVDELGSRRYTSVVDLHLVLSLSQLPQVNRNRFRVRYAREVTLDDLKQANLVLSGSLDANPWVELFQKEMNFQFEPPKKEGDVVIHNLHPLPGERSFYETNQAAPTRTTYGLIASMPNLDGTGHVLLIEGINMAGTEAAADYLFSSESAPLLNQVFDAKGNLQTFEVLLETSNIGASAPHPQIIAQRIGRR